MQFPGMTQMLQTVKTPPKIRLILGGVLTVMSVWICLMLLPTRLPGMALAGIGPNWLLIWVVKKKKEK